MPNELCMDLALVGATASMGDGSPKTYRAGSPLTLMPPNGCIRISASIGSVAVAPRIRSGDGDALYGTTDPAAHEAVSAVSCTAFPQMRGAEMDTEAFFGPNSAACVEGA